MHRSALRMGTLSYVILLGYDQVEVHVQKGHWTYECKNAPAYTARPSRTEQLLNPKVTSCLDTNRVSHALGGVNGLQEGCAC